MFWILLCFLLMMPFPSCCQDCEWSGIVKVDAKNSPGSDGIFNTTSTKALLDGIFITWRLDSNTIAQHTYSTASSSFSFFSPDPTRYISSIEIISADVVTTGLVIKNLQRTENNSALEITRSGCPGDGGTIRLMIEDCNKDFYKPNATASAGSAACGFNCQVQFNCVAACQSGSFSGVCQADTSWSPAVPQCPTSTCAVLPPGMNFTSEAANVECGMTENVTCNGVSAQLCGSTIGRCTTLDNNVTQDDDLATFNCTQACSVEEFKSVAKLPLSSPVCGGTARFECHCEGTIFFRQCGRYGIWTNTTSPCSEGCNGDGRLSGGAIAGIVIGALVVCGGLLTIILKVNKLACFKD